MRTERKVQLGLRGSQYFADLQIFVEKLEHWKSGDGNLQSCVNVNFVVISQINKSKRMYPLGIMTVRTIHPAIEIFQSGSGQRTDQKTDQHKNKKRETSCLMLQVSIYFFSPNINCNQDPVPNLNRQNNEVIKVETDNLSSPNLFQVLLLLSPLLQRQLERFLFFSESQLPANSVQHTSSFSHSVYNEDIRSSSLSFAGRFHTYAS